MVKRNIDHATDNLYRNLNFLNKIDYRNTLQFTIQATSHSIQAIGQGRCKRQWHSCYKKNPLLIR